MHNSKIGALKALDSSFPRYISDLISVAWYSTYTCRAHEIIIWRGVQNLPFTAGSTRQDALYQPGGHIGITDNQLHDLRRAMMRASQRHSPDPPSISSLPFMYLRSFFMAVLKLSSRNASFRYQSHSSSSFCTLSFFCQSFAGNAQPMEIIVCSEYSSRGLVRYCVTYKS